VVIQILDDLGDFRQVANSGELTLSKDAERSVVVAYAREVLPPDQQVKFMEILASAPEDLNATQQIIDLLIQYGAELYLDIEIEHQRELGIAALNTTNPHSPAGETLLSVLTNLGKDSFPAR
jgi:geranylgeranyl pyrophosphate synthase